MTQLQQEYREFLKSSSWYKHVGEGNAPEAAYLALGLGEAGEFQGEIKKIVRKTGFTDNDAFSMALRARREKLLLELGDVNWYLTRWCDYLNVGIGDLQVLNVRKLYNRMKEMDQRGELPIVMPKWPLSTVTPDEADVIHVKACT